MKLIPNWTKAYKSLAVVLPFAGFLIIQAADAIAATQGIGLIPDGYQQHFGFLYAALAFIGRVINQGDIFKHKDGEND